MNTLNQSYEEYRIAKRGYYANFHQSQVLFSQFRVLLDENLKTQMEDKKSRLKLQLNIFISFII